MSKWKHLTEKSKESGMYFVRIAVAIGTFLLLIMMIRWAGIKGVLMLFLGMGIMAYLLLSKNIMLLALIDKLEGNEYIDEIKKKK